MPYDHLSEFLSDLRDQRELMRIAVEVDPRLELAGVTDRVGSASASPPALFFERVAGTSVPVVTHLLASESRLCRALGIRTLDEIVTRIRSFLRPEIPQGWLDRLKVLPQLNQLANLAPQITRTAICQQVVKLGRDVDLSEFPWLTSWPLESHPNWHSVQIVSRAPDGSNRGLGRASVILRSPQSCQLLWPLVCSASDHLTLYRQQNQRMPVALVIGGTPEGCLAASLPIRTGIDPWLVWGFLRNRGLELVAGRTVDLEVPTQAEIVIEGYIDPHEPPEQAGVIAGPTGNYQIDAFGTIFHVTAVTQRANPVVPATIFSRFCPEEACLTRALLRLCLPIVQLLIPELVDWSVPPSANGTGILFVAIRKTYAFAGRKVLSAIAGLAPQLLTKLIVIVDEHVNPHDSAAVWQQVTSHVHPGRDVVFLEGPGCRFDPAAPLIGAGRPMGIDATWKLAAEGHPRDWPAELVTNPEWEQQITRRWADYGLASLSPTSI